MMTIFGGRAAVAWPAASAWAGLDAALGSTATDSSVAQRARIANRMDDLPISLEGVSQLQLNRPRRLIRVRHPEARTLAPRARINQFAVAILRQVRDRGRRLRAVQVHRILHARDRRRVRDIEQI